MTGILIDLIVLEVNRYGDVPLTCPLAAAKKGAKPVATGVLSLAASPLWREKTFLPIQRKAYSPPSFVFFTSRSLPRWSSEAVLLFD